MDFVGQQSNKGRLIREDEEGNLYSEVSITFQLDNGKWINIASIDAEGKPTEQADLEEFVRKNGPKDPVTGEKLPVYDTVEEAVAAAEERSNNLLPEMAHGGLMTGDMSDGCGCPSCMMKKIMGVDMGMMNMMNMVGTSDMVGVDPVSGNEIPPGSNAENVRDDLPVMLSDGEYVMPADAVRYHGLKFLDSLRMEAKAGLMAMMSEGQIQTIEEEEEAQQYVEDKDDEDDEDDEEVQTYTTEEGNEVEEPEMEVTTKRMSMFMPYKPSQSFAFVK